MGSGCGEDLMRVWGWVRWGLNEDVGVGEVGT